MMTFDEMIDYYGFVTNDQWCYYCQISKASWVVIDKYFDEVNKTYVYDFYKISYQKKKSYEKKINEFFLIRRVNNYFEFLNELKQKEKLKPFGGSEKKYREHLREQTHIEQRKVNRDMEMKEASLLFYDGKGRRKIAVGQMKMDFK